jgi:hypothetical protein
MPGTKTAGKQIDRACSYGPHSKQINCVIFILKLFCILILIELNTLPFRISDKNEN